MTSLVALGRCLFYLCLWPPVVVFLQICGGKVRGQCLVALLDVQQTRLRFRRTDLSEHPRMLGLLGEGAAAGLALGQGIPSLASLGTRVLRRKR